MKNKNTIEFTPTSSEPLEAPWKRTVHPVEDLIFKDGFTKLKLENGPNWFRIVPALMGADNWMANVPVVEMGHGRFVHPSAFRDDAQSAFAVAERWFKMNAPEELLSRDNPSGHRFRCRSLAACWCLVENKAGGKDAGGVHARLFLGSTFEGGGKNGSPAGLGHRIWEKLTEPDPDVDVVAEPMDPLKGTMVCIEKEQEKGAKYPTCHVRVGRRASPIQDLFDRMERAEFAKLCPVEQTLRELSEEEEWGHLGRVIGVKMAELIRSSVA
jgi:hypothetical protein